MTLIWLVVWLLSGLPTFEFTVHHPSAWFIALIVCAAIDIFRLSD